jgi:hypothetical protein
LLDFFGGGRSSGEDRVPAGGAQTFAQHRDDTCGGGESGDGEEQGTDLVLDPLGRVEGVDDLVLGDPVPDGAGLSRLRPEVLPVGHPEIV